MRKPGWALLVIDAVSPILNQSPSFFFIFYEAKLDSEVRVLEDQLEEERAKRGQATDEMMHETKQWLAGLQHSVGLCIAIRS